MARRQAPPDYELAEILRDLRLQADISQDQMAELCGLDRKTIIAYEKTGANVSMRIIRRYKDAAQKRIVKTQYAEKEVDELLGLAKLKDWFQRFFGDL